MIGPSAAARRRSTSTHWSGLGRFADRAASVVLSWPVLVRVLVAAVLVGLFVAAFNVAAFGSRLSDWVFFIESMVSSGVILWITNRSWVPRTDRPGPVVLGLDLLAIAVPLIAALRGRPIWLTALAGSALIVAFLSLYRPLPLARGHRVPRKLRATA